MVQFKAGTYKKNFAGDYKYQSYLPAKINKPYQWENEQIDSLLEEASHKLSGLNTYALQTPDIDFFIKMHIAKEATTSSRIEGTRTEIEEVFMKKENIVPEKRDDWEEVKNYIKAMNLAIKEQQDLPLSTRLLKKAHKKLLSGVRGEDKRPGKIRKTQNWIGGKKLENANFIPPHPDDLPELLSDLEKFWHNDKLQLPHLIKAGMSHYQFETIHPFLDGNGRIGRLLITLYLISVGILDKPVLYLSDYFAHNRTEYFQSLTQVRKDNNMDQWLEFFLKGVINTSEQGTETLQKVVALRKDYLELINKKIGTRQQELAQRSLAHLFSNPLVSVQELSNKLEVTFPTANSLLRKMEQAGVIKETTGKQRGRRFKLQGYLDIFK